MGGSQCKEGVKTKEFKKSRKEHIEKKPKECKKESDKKLKFLLMGICGSGKSTIHKLFSQQPPNIDRETIVYNLAGQIVEALIETLSQLESVTLPIPDASVQSSCTRLKEYENHYNNPYLLQPEMVETILTVRDHVIDVTNGLTEHIDISKLCGNHGGAFLWLLRSAHTVFEWFLRPENKDGSIASEADDSLYLSLMRVITTGIVQTDFQVASPSGALIQAQMNDVGGPRSERRKWIQCFDNARPIIVISAMAFFSYLVEGDTYLSWDEVKLIYEGLLNSKWIDLPAAVVFTHCDLLWEHLFRPDALGTLSERGFPVLSTDLYHVCLVAFEQLLLIPTIKRPSAFYCVNSLASSSTRECISHFVQFSSSNSVSSSIPLLYPPPPLADLLIHPSQMSRYRASASLFSLCEQIIRRHVLTASNVHLFYPLFHSRSFSPLLKWSCESLLRLF